MRTIHFYRSESGACPVEDFLDSLSGEQVQKVTWVLQLIEDLEVIPAQYFKKLVNTDDLWEVRIQAGNNIFRLLGFLEGKQVVILNHAFQKKTQKTPAKEILIAEARKKEYLKRRK
ncbi:Phage-related protein [Nitrosomonas ureae]|uniref:Phage-related protein n=1 Tax=Nitrosomonas ureae TaxID=44577 RepID=A0A285BXN0_9PROT|nr:type II toxin-antitoxin system RelE/ParE family toxin [Nitrosomonas ureae]SNX59676.1 Phage-related protein [Nitrosomonas ureae]